MPKLPIQTIDSVHLLIDAMKPRLLESGSSLVYGDKYEIPGTNMKAPARELLGLCLLSLVAEHITGLHWNPSTDPFQRDGALLHPESGTGVLLEQVFVTSRGKTKSSLYENIRSEVAKKDAKGLEYAKDMNLFILCDHGGEIDTRILVQDFKSSLFEAIWIAGRLDEMKPMYMVEILKHPIHKLARYCIDLGELGNKARLIPCKQNVL